MVAPKEDQCVWIIRYGLTQLPLVEGKGPFDSPLHNPDGKIHAQAIADYLKSSDAVPDIVYSSPFLRTAETAHIIAETCGCSTAIELGLTEWQVPSLLIDEAGTHTHPKSAEELSKLFPTIDTAYQSVNPPSDDQPGAPKFPESPEDLLLRCRTTIDRLLAQTSGHICIVSHAPCDQGIAYAIEGAASPEASQLKGWPMGGITKFCGSTMELYGSTKHMPGIYTPGIKKWSLPMFPLT